MGEAMDQAQRSKIISDLLDKQLLALQRQMSRQPSWFERLGDRPGLILAFCLFTAIALISLGALSVVGLDLLLGHP